MDAAENPNLDLEKHTSNVVPSSLEKKQSKPQITHTSSDPPSSANTDIEKSTADKKTDEPQHYVDEEEEPEYPSTKKLIPIIGSVYLAFFLIALVSLKVIQSP